MNMNFVKFSAFALMGAMVVSAGAETMDRPQGIKIGQRLTLRPYVALSCTYDTNVAQRKDGSEVTTWIINPGINLTYVDDNWDVTGNIWYRYHAYNRYVDSLNESSFGETLTVRWANSQPNERGWTLMLSESYSDVTCDDSLEHTDGRGLWRDRQTFQVTAALERRINERWHADINGSYYMLDYENSDEYGALYGWSRTVGGIEFGYAASKWTDFLIAANYQLYSQDNVCDRDDIVDSAARGGNPRSNSDGWSIMAGIATRATDRISYRLLTGWSRFDYAGLSTVDGWTYSASLNWKMTDNWNMMFLGSSYYQPSERNYGASLRVDTFSWGIAHSMVRGKLNVTFDLAYRHEQNEYSEYQENSYDEDIASARLGINYTLNRFLSIFGRAEYQTEDVSGNSQIGRDYDFDRWRATLGLRLTY